ncbi:melatonin receptor type 1B-B-like [Zerene cesonia]|uniref:melatonin receptor type 1B-B-like n=1 Tax=Zerene cesonia TaxID=33412 RepID=UPI0018E54FAD|nr:melatonin receptor type 1B-B-like [Zerene cesonia]
MLNRTTISAVTLYSPVTLSGDWPKVGRLIFMVALSTIGTILNGFFVASFFVEYSLRRVGFVFLACVGLADLLITGGVMPISSVVLLSGEWDNEFVCNVQQFLAVSATYCYSLFFMCVAAENYLRLCCSQAAYDMLINCNVGFISVFIFLLSFSLGGVGVYLGLDYDYCKRAYIGNSYYRVISTALFHALPSACTIFCLISSYYGVRRRASQQISYRRSLAYGRDSSIATLNIIAYLFFFSAWIPYLIFSIDLPGVTDTKYYYSIWIGLGRSVFTSFMYGILNRNFRRAFAHLFNYCCCKSTLSGPLASRHRREYRQGTSDVRVHIMHQAVSTSSPQRATSSIRETQEL